jgi:hypothetical protein
VSLTVLHSTVFDEALKSGLFDPQESLLLSRAIGNIDVYNLQISILQSLATNEVTQEVGDRFYEASHTLVAEINRARDDVLESMKDLENYWPTKEVREAVEAYRRSTHKNDVPRLGSEKQSPSEEPEGTGDGSGAAQD